MKKALLLRPANTLQRAVCANLQIFSNTPTMWYACNPAVPCNNRLIAYPVSVIRPAKAVQ